MNLALLRVFGILIAVHELNRLVRLLVHIGYDHSVPVVIMTAASIAAGIVVLAKNNTLVLKALFFKWKNLT